MNGTVGNLECRFRLFGAVTPNSVSGFERVARDEMAEELEVALDALYGDDPAVYLVRHVHTSVGVAVTYDYAARSTARKWAGRIAGLAARTIDEDVGDASSVIRFSDQGEYIARFAIDLVGGVAWDRWYYHPFDDLQSHGSAAALRVVLIENVDHLDSLLRHLRRFGALDRILAALDPATLELLWRRGFGAAPASADTFRPLLAVALSIVDALGIWVGARPSMEHILAGYLAGSPSEPSWRDATSLARGVLDIVRYLLSLNLIRRVEVDSEDVDLSRALADFDWLDGQWLRERLVVMLSPATELDLSLPALRPSRTRATPAQQEIMRLIGRLIDEGVDLDHGRPSDRANAVRLYARMIESRQDLAGNPVVISMVEQFLGAWELLRQATDSSTVASALRTGDVERALTVAHGEVPASGKFGLISALGAIAAGPLSSLLEIATPSTGSGVDGIETQCAGLFLLIRAVLDLRLPALVQQAFMVGAETAPTFNVLLASIALAWSGDDAIDPGIAVLAGIDPGMSAMDLAASMAAASEDQLRGLQRELAQQVMGLRLMTGSPLCISALRLVDGIALVGGEGPFGEVIERVEQAPETMRRWVESLSEWLGQPPLLWSGDDRISAVLSKDFGQYWGEPSESDIGQRLESLSAGVESMSLPPAFRGTARLTVQLTAMCVVRVWARWLRQFANSSVPYLLDNLIRRPGIVRDGRDLVVEMEQRSLDIVMHMAGYSSDTPPVPWLGGRTIRFVIRGR